MDAANLWPMVDYFNQHLYVNNLLDFYDFYVLNGCS